MKATITARALSVGVTAAGDLAESKPASAGDLSLTMTNQLATVQRASAAAEVVSVSRTRRTIHQGEQQLVEVQVPAGATFLRAAVSEVTDLESDLDIYLLDCTVTPPAATPVPPAVHNSSNKAPEEGAAPTAHRGRRRRRCSREGRSW